MEEGFAETLIAEVQERPALWNRKFQHYRNRVVIDKDWADVADNLGITKEAAKLKWRNLRDNFKKELKKIPKSTDGSAELIYKGKWSYFTHMLFLKDILEPQHVDEHIVTDAETMNFIENGLIENLDNENHFMECPISPNISIRTDSISDTSDICNGTNEDKKTSLKRCLMNADPYDTTAVEAKSQKLSSTQDSSDNEDLHFFRSLLPYMAMLPPIKKLQVRNQFHFVLIKEITSLTDDRGIFGRKPSSGMM